MLDVPGLLQAVAIDIKDFRFCWCCVTQLLVILKTAGRQPKDSRAYTDLFLPVPHHLRTNFCHYSSLGKFGHWYA